jgi:DNA-binding response OmpR family regulator
VVNNLPSKSKIVLIIEDDTVLSKMYSQKLQSEGFSVLNAGDGEEGYEMIMKNKVDLVLTDIMLPRVSGIDFLQKLNANKKKSKVPVIAWSNLPDDQENALKLGAKEYLIKGQISLDQIAAIVKKYIG